MMYEFFLIPFYRFCLCFFDFDFSFSCPGYYLSLIARGYSFCVSLLFPLTIVGSGTLYRVFCIAFPFPYCR